MYIFQWTSRDFGLDTQGKCRASSPFSLAKGDSSAKLNDYVRVFNKSEEVKGCRSFFLFLLECVSFEFANHITESTKNSFSSPVFLL